MRHLSLLICAIAAVTAASADDGYRLWLRYDAIPDAALRQNYAAAAPQIVVPATLSPTLAAARDELATGLAGLLGASVPVVAQPATGSSALVIGTPANQPEFAKLDLAADLARAGDEGYVLRSVSSGGRRRIVIAANSDVGVLYGAFAFLRHLQTERPLDDLAVVSAPRIQRRLLNHWDNLNRFIERGYAGFSLWEWFYLPEIRSPRYRDYARACASIGINGSVINNVNANALILTPDYLRKVAALAEEFRPYGVRVYLTARFSAPIEIGGLKTADPLDPAVAAWWRAKVDEIYSFVPDLGGFLVKANSEGQPGPQDYQRNHADGANLFADALAPHGGIVMWRAFVYQPDNTEDRVKQASSEFNPLDGSFRDNVVIQIKNGPLDFMPREPFSPLFGSLKRSTPSMELQIAQEYLGHSTHLVYLAPLWKEVLDADTFAFGPGSTVARVIDGSLARGPARADGDSAAPAGNVPLLPERATRLSVIAGVANTGTDRNWTGHPLAQANWFAYGRLAWDHALSSEEIADEWTRMTFGSDPALLATIEPLLLGSRETAVNYSMPLGLHHIMEVGHHYGPGPWVMGGRPDWTSPYYHQADETGLGANRGPGGSNALENYAPEWRAVWGNLETCPENLLLWFHHVPWDHRMKSGRPLWDELCLRYQQGVDEVRTMQRTWATFEGRIDDEHYTAVRQRLVRQEIDAREWRDACLLYFQQFSKRPLPAGVEPPEHSLQHYIDVNLRFVPGHPSDH